MTKLRWYFCTNNLFFNSSLYLIYKNESYYVSYDKKICKSDFSLNLLKLTNNLKEIFNPELENYDDYMILLHYTKKLDSILYQELIK